MRDIPDRLHKELVRRASASGQTLTDYVQKILEREVARPPAEEVFERIHGHPPVNLGRPAADLIRMERRERRQR